ncbi:hypothetical protein CMI47_12845 [Candidatus Pacearchaeota archaeon]|nr:hypothetical protein [Candidatus Pacearchaeota archaeon]|tara:strand:+ start:856 stop:1122 length:267 start_codon:yes stop_codon:yes gene_type:complete
MKTTKERLAQLEKVHAEAKELFCRKNSDYGDSFSTYGPIGVIMRLGDKIQRLTSISKNTIQIESESMRDTLIDLHNYAAMVIMLLDED